MKLPVVDVRRYLQPLSWLYGVGVNFRNWLYDRKILKQKKFDIPVICVGNITVGGTGKTPHIEYLSVYYLLDTKLQYSAEATNARAEVFK